MGRKSMPAGRYYIGDPCYVIADWDAFCHVWFQQDGGIFDFDGYSVCAYNTQYGDGCYPASDGSMLGVDAGIIGAVPAALMTTGDYDMGTEVEFREPFECYRDYDGRMHFGTFEVMTGDEENEDRY